MVRIAHNQETMNTHQLVSIELSELISVLNEALAKRRIWVDDFSDEKVSISADLHQVIVAAKNFG